MMIKIIKEFEDSAFGEKLYRGPKWRWGLGEDRELYYRAQADYDWNPVKERDNGYIARNIGILDMQRIVNQFAHLLVLL